MCNGLERIKIHQLVFRGTGEKLVDFIAVHVNEKKILTQQSLRSFEEVLPPNDFIRIHKSFIIALGKIDYIEKNRVYIAGKPLPISESYRDHFNAVISGKK